MRALWLGLRSAGLVVAIAGACNPPTARETVKLDPSVAPTPPPSESASCKPPPSATALARISATPCSWWVAPGPDERLHLQGGPGPATSVPLAVPEGCLSGCTYDGVDTAVGPVLVAIQPDPSHELPAEVFIGAALGGEVVAFAPLWHGPRVRVDYTEVGPAHALVPWVCPQQGLVLLRGVRLPGLPDEPPTAELLAHEGVYAVSADGLTKTDAPAPAVTGCQRVELLLP